MVSVQGGGGGGFENKFREFLQARAPPQPRSEPAKAHAHPQLAAKAVLMPADLVCRLGRPAGARDAGCDPEGPG
jgi:hypothetical protein